MPDRGTCRRPLKSSRQFLAAALYSAAALAPVSHASAQPTGVLPGDTSAAFREINASDHLTLRLEPYGIAGLETDIDGGGDVAIRRAGWRFRYSQPVDRAWAISLNITNEYTVNDFTAPPSIGGGDPFDTLTIVRVLPGVTWTNDRGDWSFSLIGRLEFSGESGSETGGSFLGGGVIMAERRINDRLKVGMGIAIAQRHEDDVQVFVLPTFDWKVSETWRIFSDQLGANIEKQIAQSWFVSFKTRYESREWRLSDSSGGVSPDGVLRDNSMLVGLELAWRPRPGVDAGVEVGGIVFQKFKILNDTGGRIFKETADPTVFISASLAIQF